ncbi:MAG: septum formation inhibitor Maf, partial [Hydrogenimonas sp.]|nr:septum formation inhibitor Maf [Hydrogenimonas sp.]
WKTRGFILKAHSIPFVQKGCDFDEDALEHSVPKDFVYHAAVGKLALCEKSYGLGMPILCADTVVTAYGQILRKAADEDEALRILRLQSGSCVSIITCTAYKSLKKMFVDLSETTYRFAPFDEADLMRYIESGEWRGKAGARMVEGFCKKYIRSVDGYESCAMGLSIEKLLPWLEKERA